MQDAFKTLLLGEGKRVNDRRIGDNGAYPVTHGEIREDQREDDVGI